MRALALAGVAVLVALAPALAQESQEIPKVPKDSVQIVATGCLKGRVFAVTGRPEEPEVRSGPDVTGRSFRLAGQKDVMSEVKRHNGNTVEIIGLIRKSDLEERGLRLGGGRVVIGAGRPTDPTRPNLPNPTDHVVVMDVSSIRAISTGCIIDQRD